MQLVGTAHGQTLDNLMMNPTLCDLVGGIQTVTLSDEEARRRGTQKSVLERKSPPTFDTVVEIQDWDRVALRADVAEAVDAILRGRSLAPEIRVRHPSGEIESMYAEPEVVAAPPESPFAAAASRRRVPEGRPSVLRIYPYGLNQNRIRQASRRLNLPVLLVNDLGEADALFTLRTYYRKRPQVIADAERRGTPVYVLRNNTAVQMESYLAEIFGLSAETDTVQQALEEARTGIEQVMAGQRNSVRPGAARVVQWRMQHELAREANSSRAAPTEPGATSPSIATNDGTRSASSPRGRLAPVRPWERYRAAAARGIGRVRNVRGPGGQRQDDADRALGAGPARHRTAGGGYP